MEAAWRDLVRRIEPEALRTERERLAREQKEVREQLAALPPGRTVYAATIHHGKGNFRVVVTPDNHFAREDGWPDDRYLRQGVRANGWVLLKQVPLGYEIWRQLNGFPPVVADKAPAKSGDKVPLPKL